MPTLNDAEARVLGVLIEKSLTTPDSYPLSINAALNACNQKSNRDPVTSYVEAEVVVALQGLLPKGLAGRVMAAGSRVEKFRHTANAALGLDDGRLAVLAELLLRGPQSPGELRARVHRMSPTASLEELSSRLDGLIAAGIVERVPPSPGSRAERYAQLLAPGLHPVAVAPAAAPRPSPSPAVPAAAGRALLEERVEALERQVAELSARFDDLLARLGG
ncbi:MAG: DUF480 domain-containing protein [Planctomycetota bacterium]